MTEIPFFHTQRDACKWRFANMLALYPTDANCEDLECLIMRYYTSLSYVSRDCLISCSVMVGVRCVCAIFKHGRSAHWQNKEAVISEYSMVTYIN